MDPVTILTIAAVTAIGASAAGAGVSAYASRQEGKAANAAAQAQAAQYERQAKLEEQRAAVAQLQGEQEEQKRMRTLSQDIGSMYTQFAGNGLDINTSGSVGDALKTTATEGYADSSTIKQNTAMNVWGHLANAESYRNDASISLFKGKASKQGGTLGAWGKGLSWLGGAAKDVSAL